MRKKLLYLFGWICVVLSVFWIFWWIYVNATDNGGWWEKQSWCEGQECSDVYEKKDSKKSGTNSSSEVGLNLSDECLMKWWKWCFKMDYLLWWKNSKIAQRNDKRTILNVLQDVVLAATYMVWTVLTIVLMYCWLMYIIASWTWKDPNNYKRWLKYAAIWSVLVRCAYAIVRLIQYIAKW